MNIMKGYMASGQFSRGRRTSGAEGGIVMVAISMSTWNSQQRVATC